MRHGNKVNALGRKYGHRKALLGNLAVALITHKRIRTTTAKAKALRSYVEPIINRSKENTTHSRRMAFRYLHDKQAVTELFDVIGGKVADRPGGYTRILKLGTRPGDNAEMAYIELVDFNENMLKEAKKKTRRSRRTRRSSGKGAAPAAEASASKAEQAAEAASDAASQAASAAEAAKATGADAAEAERAQDAVADADIPSDTSSEAKDDAASKEEDKDKA
jgi:large subunit ribosomal protein L17